MYFVDQTRISLEDTATDNYIEFIKSEDIQHTEGYNLTVNPDKNTVTITAKTSAGAMYGCQSLLSLLHGNEGKLPAGHIEDSPR